MSAVIRMDQALCEAVSTPYRDLVTRPTGAAVRHHVIMTLQQTALSDTQAELDFTYVGLMDFSCADEVVAKLMLEMMDSAALRLVLRGVRDDHADAIDAALQRYELVVVAKLLESPEPRLLGSASDDWRQAFAALTRVHRSAVHPVAQFLAWPVARTAAALNGLAYGRCVIAHPDATFEAGAYA